MKKYGLLKALAIALFAIVLFSWCIPAGTYSNGGVSTLDATTPIGIVDIIRLPFMTMATFVQFFLLFLVIGGFYGVLNKTTVYSKLVDKVAKTDKKKFLICTVIVMAVLASMAGNVYTFFVVCPFLIAVLLKMGYNKFTAVAATVGSILVGQIGTTIGFNIWGLLSYVFNLKMTSVIWARIIFLAVSVALYVITLNKYIASNPAKKGKKTIEERIPLYEDATSKKSFMPLVVISCIAIVLVLVGTYDWNFSFKATLFDSMHDAITGFEIGGYYLIQNLFGSVSAIGAFTNYDVMIVLIIAALIIGWIYNVKLNDMLSGFIDGCKEMIVPALYAVLSFAIFTAVVVLNSNKGVEGSFSVTMIGAIMSKAERFNAISVVLSSAIMSFTHTDFYTLLTTAAPILGSYTAKTSAVAFGLQAIYGLVMLIAPTSTLLLVGLSYLDVEYKDWVKYIWKYLLIILAVVIAIVFILAA